MRKGKVSSVDESWEEESISSWYNSFIGSADGASEETAVMFDTDHKIVTDLRDKEKRIEDEKTRRRESGHAIIKRDSTHNGRFDKRDDQAHRLHRRKYCLASKDGVKDRSEEITCPSVTAIKRFSSDYKDKNPFTIPIEVKREGQKPLHFFVRVKRIDCPDGSGPLFQADYAGNQEPVGVKDAYAKDIRNLLNCAHPSFGLQEARNEMQKRIGTKDATGILSNNGGFSFKNKDTSHFLQGVRSEPSVKSPDAQDVYVEFLSKPGTKSENENVYVYHNVPNKRTEDLFRDLHYKDHQGGTYTTFKAERVRINKSKGIQPKHGTTPASKPCPDCGAYLDPSIKGLKHYCEAKIGDIKAPAERKNQAGLRDRTSTAFWKRHKNREFLDR
jgi:hypothetical protein